MFAGGIDVKSLGHSASFFSFFFSLTGAAALSCMVPPNLYSYSDGGVAALFTKDVFVCCEQIFFQGT